MRTSQSFHLPGDTRPAEPFGRIARTFPAPQRLPTAVTESANAAFIGQAGVPGSGRGPHADRAALDFTALRAEARAHRAQVVVGLLIALLRAAAGLLRRWREQQRRHAQARAIHRELAGLDTRTLRDIGIHHRGELPFIARRLSYGEDPREFAGRR